MSLRHPHSFDPRFHRAVYAAARLEHFCRQCVVCSRGVNGLVGWLSGSPIESDHALWRVFDPVADKLIVVAALIILVSYHSNPWLTLPSLIIVGREIVISALREWMAE